MFFVLLIAAVSIWFLYTKWKLAYWSRKGVPHPKPNIFFGNIGGTLNFSQHIGCLTEKWYNEFNDVPYFGYYKFSSPAVVVRDPELIKDVLIKEFNSFSENDTHLSKKHDPLLALNPFICQGEEWKRGRTLLTPLFSAAKIKSIYPMMETACESLTKFIRSHPRGTDFDAKELCALFTTDNVFKCSFSMNAGCFESPNSEFRQLGRMMLQPSKTMALKFMMMPLLPKWLADPIPIPLLPSVVDKWFRSIVVENRKSRQNLSRPLDDFMQMLLNSANKLGASDLEISAHSLSLFFEGFETSSAVLSYVLYELARNPDIQDRVHSEVVEVLEKHDNKFSYEALQEMTYLECVLHEAQRMHPVLHQLTKVCTAEYTLPKIGNQMEGVKIHPGTTVVVPVRGIHFDPEHYPDPHVFDPDRFTEEERKTRNKALYLPFGEGPRMCMGMRFGHTQVKAAAMTIVRDYVVRISHNHKPMVQDPQSFIWIPKNGILLNFEPRT